MKLVIGVVHGRDAEDVLRALTHRGYRATQIDSAGGFLRQGNVTLLIGVQETLVADVLRVITQHGRSRTQYANPLLPITEPAESYVSHPVEYQVGGATVFVVNIERYERIA